MGNGDSSTKQTTGKVRVTVVGASVKLAKRHSTLFKDPNVFVVVSTNSYSYELEAEIQKMPKGTSVPSDELRKVLQTFKCNDADGNGTISLSEFQKLFQTLDPSLKPDKIQQLFISADTSADGQIDYQEFVAWLYDEDAPQNKDLSLPPLEAQKAFKTKAKKHSSKPRWNEIGIIDVGGDEKLIFRLYDSFTFHKDTLILEFEPVEPRFDELESKVHLTGEVNGTVVELDVVIRPDDSLRMNIGLCNYMPNITGDIKKIQEQHFGDKVLIKDFVAHINKQHSKDMKLEDLYCVTYFGFVSGPGPDFHPLEGLAETFVGEQPQNKTMLEFQGRSECLFVMPKAVTVQVQVDAAKYEVKLDASAMLPGVFEQLKQQHSVDLMSGGYVYEYEHEFMNQKTTTLVPLDGGGSDEALGLLKRVTTTRVYALLERQPSRKNFKFFSAAQCPTRLIRCLAALRNGANMFGSVSVSLGFSDLKMEVPNSSAIASLLSTQLGGKNCYIFIVSGENVVGKPSQVTGEELTESFNEGEVWAFLPHSSPEGRHVPMGPDMQEAIEEYTGLGDSKVEGYFFTKFFPEDKKQTAVQIIRQFNGGHARPQPVYIRRIHNSNNEEDQLSDKECSIM